jgi:HSF-type DNA-binding
MKELFSSIETPKVYSSPGTRRAMKSSKSEASFSALSFPRKMYVLLDDAEREGFDNIISWQPTGTSFRIHRPDLFVEGVLKNYFSQSRLKSFQRQLNIYGFKKVSMGPHKGGYQHKYFIRGQPELCSNIHRHRILKKPLAGSDMKPIHLDEAEVSTLFDFFYPQDPQTRKHIQHILSDDDTVATQDDRDNLDLDGFQFDAAELEQLSPVVIDTGAAHHRAVPMESRDPAASEEELSDLSFPYKMHLLVDNAEKDNYSHIVSWTKDGKAFQVHDVEAFVKTVLPLFFDQSKYESFRRQLNLYQFKRVARGDLRGTISHPNFVRGARWMCEEIKRVRFQHR